MSDSKPPSQSKPTADDRKMVYQQICADLQNIADYRLKLFGFLPITTAGSFLVTILTSSTITNSILNNVGQKTAVQNLVLPFGVLGAIITVALFLYEGENISLAYDLLERGKVLEADMGVAGQFAHRQSHLFSSRNGSRVMYSAVFAGWVCIALWFTLPSRGLTLLLSLSVFIIALLVSGRFRAWKQSSPMEPQNQLTVPENPSTVQLFKS